jgi:hypothetical protein
VPIKRAEDALSPEQRRQEAVALLALAVRRLVKRPGACIEHGPIGEHRFASDSPLDASEDGGRDRPLRTNGGAIGGGP